MRTYDDSFSGQKIYPGKVRSATRAPQLSAPAHVEIPTHRTYTRHMGDWETAGPRTIECLQTRSRHAAAGAEQC
jgi:hypothetical protein